MPRATSPGLACVDATEAETYVIRRCSVKQRIAVLTEAAHVWRGALTVDEFVSLGRASDRDEYGKQKLACACSHSRETLTRRRRPGAARRLRDDGRPCSARLAPADGVGASGRIDDGAGGRRRFLVTALRPRRQTRPRLRPLDPRQAARALRDVAVRPLVRRVWLRAAWRRCLCVSATRSG